MMLERLRGWLYADRIAEAYEQGADDKATLVKEWAKEHRIPETNPDYSTKYGRGWNDALYKIGRLLGNPSAYDQYIQSLKQPTPLDSDSETNPDT